MQVFGPSRLKVAFTAMATAYIWWAAFDDYRRLPQNSWEVWLAFGVAAGLTAVLAWLLSLKLTLSAETIEYRSLLGATRMRLQDVREIYIWLGFRKIFYVIPVLPACRYRLVARTGEQLVFGSLLRGGRFAGQKVVLITAQRLCNAAAEQFNRGQEVSFGTMRISQKGVWTDGWKSGTYAWSEVQSIEPSMGGLFLNLSGGRTAGGRGMADIPNAQVLVLLVSMGIEMTKKGQMLQFPVHQPQPRGAAPRSPNR